MASQLEYLDKELLFNFSVLILCPVIVQRKKSGWVR